MKRSRNNNSNPCDKCCDTDRHRSFESRREGSGLESAKMFNKTENLTEIF